ncbi:unnamed protein product [Linum tenue]|uniref:Uncharacterized protein n=1 Tax=Linum tenue TaxID=586396 RepID=A0AAV0IDP2_9ROSI|nr:unnamed protein product [Linum tenue]
MLKEDGSAPSSGSFQSLMASVLRQKSLPDSWHLGNPQLLLNQIQLIPLPTGLPNSALAIPRSLIFLEQCGLKIV